MTSVSPRFRDRVFAHLVANAMKEPAPATPVILAIHGEPGTGKSFQLAHALNDTRTFYKTISSSDLESANANDPAKLLRSAYLQVADEVWEKGHVTGALVINDIDSALGDWGPLVQTTVNRQMVIGEMQHITDYPDSVDNRANQRIPIFVTANDLTKLYGPLLRPGRTESFYWAPTSDELKDVLSQALPHLSRHDVAEFVARVDSRSVVDHLSIVREATARNVARIAGSPHDILLRARKGELGAAAPPSLADLWAAHRALSAEQNHRRDYSGGPQWQEPAPIPTPTPVSPSSRSTSARLFGIWDGLRSTLTR